MMANFQKVSFLSSAPKLSLCPPDEGIEIAFAGRSNAGKSTALNTLVKNKKLAKTSKTPGRTQLINFFELNEKKLTPEKAAMAKWWLTELELKIVDQCLQLHGGYGYIKEYPIAKAYLNSRVQTIYGGTTEIMKEIIGKSLGF